MRRNRVRVSEPAVGLSSGRERHVPVFAYVLAFAAIVAIVAAFAVWFPKATRGVVIGGFCLIVLGLVAFVIGLVWDIAYPRVMVWLADRHTLRARRLVRVEPDEHGFQGVVYDSETNALHDLDTGEGFRLGDRTPADPYRVEINGRQRTVAALTGASIQQSVQRLLAEGAETPSVEVAGLGDAGPWLQIEQPDGESDKVIQA